MTARSFTNVLLALLLLAVIGVGTATAVAASHSVKVPGFAGYRSRHMSSNYGDGQTAYRWQYTDGLQCVSSGNGSPTCNWDALNQPR